ncbi:MAG: AraC family transcriptional regulator [Ginsengibacter sp.]
MKYSADLQKVISLIIDFIPDNNALYITAETIEKDDNEFVSVKLRNTGINLTRVPGITNITNFPVKLFSSAEKETTFEVCYYLSPLAVKDRNSQVGLGNPSYNYTSFVKRIRYYFSKLNNTVERLAETKPKEAAFLIKINDCILKNLDNEQFDANAFSDAMAMSRAQLLRRLKSITGNSPGYYIKTFRLEKAKELLETKDVTISEAAYQTGFNSPSNFAKVFSEKYGITPSQFQRTKPNATNAITNGLLLIIPL